jgi:hypothetical protein
MKRRFRGLGDSSMADESVPDGVFLVRVDKAHYQWHAHRPFYLLRLAILEPTNLAGRTISGRLDCTPKAMWKLGWFLRDFVYDPELLQHDEVDEKAVLGLRGIVKISHSVVNGRSVLNFDGFAPASQWSEFCSASLLSYTSTAEVRK